VRVPFLPVLAGLAAAGLVLGASIAPATAAGSGPSYRSDDYANGQLLSILPPGEHGLYNATDLLAFEANGTRPAGTVDQKTKYDALIYGAPTVTDSTLSTYFNDASFGIKPGELLRTEVPRSNVPVTIYRDKSEVPHIYGDTDNATEFGAGYAGAEDRLFIMDVLRHYGQGTTSAFLGPSCGDEAMDHDQLLLTGYNDAQLQRQFDQLDTLYGPQGKRFKDLFNNYVAGINAYIADTQTDPTLLPGDYAVVGAPPQPWTIKDIIGIAGLVGGIFGKGGGNELGNARLLQYLQKEIGKAQAGPVLDAFHSRNDPIAATTIRGKTFNYDIPGRIDPTTTALPDDAFAPLTGGPTNTTANCDLTAPNVPALKAVSSLLAFPKALSNALLVDAKHSTSGHPLAVFGPQVGYFTPQILMQEELHGPDLIASGASFAGTNGIVELGRGVDYAWSATSAGTDNVDTRLERLCNPTGGAVAAEQKNYLFKGRCLAMTHNTFSETAVPKPGGPGAPVVIDHELYYTVHGPVQGWTTSGGKPVAVTSQRSTYGHELDSGIGFLAWNTPSLTHDATSWMKGAGQIGYTFNWFYIDNKDIAYYCSGWNPTRPKNIDPNFPTWGDGTAEWQGMEPFNEHPHEINPPQGFFTSWNNKPAPGFSAADSQYAYGSVFRSLSLDEGIAQQFAKHSNKLTRANLVQAMSSASTVDLSGRRVLPEMLPYLAKVPLDATGKQMVTRLQAWLATGAHRIKAKAGDTQYKDADAVAIMDELYPRIIQALYDPLFKNGGVSATDGLTFNYNVFPQRFADTPNAQGAHLGSAYDGGFESFLLTSFRQLRGVKVADAFPASITSRVCAGNCPGALAKAFKDAATALTAANSSATVTSWVNNTANKSAGTTQPLYDAIHYSAVGVAGQQPADWQNRPTFQQVVMFPGHRPRLGAGRGSSKPTAPVGPARPAPQTGQLPTTGLAGGLSVLSVLLLAGGLLLRRSRRIVS
jgi:acyl-homoserine lactone acylase PvdQ